MSQDCGDSDGDVVEAGLDKEMDMEMEIGIRKEAGCRRVIRWAI